MCGGLPTVIHCTNCLFSMLFSPFSAHRNSQSPLLLPNKQSLTAQASLPVMNSLESFIRCYFGRNKGLDRLGNDSCSVPFGVGTDTRAHTQLRTLPRSKAVALVLLASHSLIRCQPYWTSWWTQMMAYWIGRLTLHVFQISPSLKRVCFLISRCVVKKRSRDITYTKTSP